MSKSKKYIKFCGLIEFKSEEFREYYSDVTDKLIPGEYNSAFCTAITKLVGCNVDIRDSKLDAKKEFTIIFRCGHKSCPREFIAKADKKTSKDKLGELLQGYQKLFSL
jgi:hypothetical protein